MAPAAAPSLMSELLGASIFSSFEYVALAVAPGMIEEITSRSSGGNPSDPKTVRGSALEGTANYCEGE